MFPNIFLKQSDVLTSPRRQSTDVRCVAAMPWVVVSPALSSQPWRAQRVSAPLQDNLLSEEDDSRLYPVVVVRIKRIHRRKVLRRVLGTVSQLYFYYNRKKMFSA